MQKTLFDRAPLKDSNKDSRNVINRNWNKELNRDCLNPKDAPRGGLRGVTQHI